MVWLHQNRPGSVIAKTGQDGAVVMTVSAEPYAERHGFDPFGRPRLGDWRDSAGPSQTHMPGYNGALNSTVTPRGFTGHEHLDSHRLIQMNGRAFDPLLGRFLSVDPIIQAPANSQSLNPYSYIMNNPLAGTDPTGYTCDPMVGTKICGVDTGGTINGASVTAVHMRVQQEERANGGGVGVTSNNNAGGDRREPSSINAHASRPSTGGGTPQRDSAPRKERDYTTYQDIEPDQVTPPDVNGVRTSIYGTPLAEIRPTYLERQAMFRQDIGNHQAGVMFSEWFWNAGPVAAMPIPIGRVGWLTRLGAGQGAARSSKQAADMRRHLGYAEEYGEAGVKHLENGRLRYYGNVSPATNAGEMAGRRYVHEFNPATGRSRGWHETVDHRGTVRQVRPEFNNGVKTHYLRDAHGNHIGSR